MRFERERAHRDNLILFIIYVDHAGLKAQTFEKVHKHKTKTLFVSRRSLMNEFMHAPLPSQV
jgi:hypothetical protein